MKTQILLQTQNTCPPIWRITSVITLFLALSTTFSFAQTPTAIPGKIAYQGKLLENEVPVTGTRTIDFSIPGTGWTETHNNVSVTKGLYSVQLGSLTPIPVTVFNSPTVSLEITVEGTTLSPQVELLSVPYAYKSEKADDATKISGNPVSTTAPAIGQTLKWDGTAWVPGADEIGNNKILSKGSGQLSFTIQGGILGTNGGIKGRVYIIGHNTVTTTTAVLSYGGAIVSTIQVNINNENPNTYQGYIDFCLLGNGETNSQLIGMTVSLAGPDLNSRPFGHAFGGTSSGVSSIDSTVDQTISLTFSNVIFGTWVVYTL